MRSSPQEKHPRHRVIKWSLGALAGLIMLGAVLVGLFRVAANLLPRYHDRIQQQVASQLHAKVTIGTISLVWQGWGPALVLRDLRIRGSANAPVVIRARALRMDFSFWSLFHGAAARPSGFHVVQPRVTLRRQPDGRITVPGLHLPQGTGPSQLKQMLGDAITATDGRVRLEFSGGAPPVWEARDVNLTIGAGRHHALSLSVRLPSALGGGRLQLSGEVSSTGVEVAGWRWHAHLMLDRFTLGGLKRFLPSGLPALGGTLAASAELAGKGMHPEHASGQFTLDDLSVGEGLVDHWVSHFDYTGGTDQALTLHDSRLVFVRTVWKPGRMQLARDASGRLHFAVQNLPLDVVPRLAGFLPPGQKALGQKLKSMAPTGQVKDLEFALTPGKTDFSMQGVLHEVSVQHVDHTPGFEHLSARVHIRDGVGRVNVDSPGLTLLMPKLFGHPVRLDTVKGEVLVAYTPAGINIGMPHLALAGPALSGALKGLITVPSKGSPYIRIAAHAEGADAVTAREHYLPHGLLPKSLNKWLMKSLGGGRITGARLYFDGPVKGFPYEHGGGHFGVRFGYTGVSLSPGFGWSPMHRLSGAVEFRNAGMRASITGGSISGAHVISGSASIPNFFHLHLLVHADVAGNAQAFLDFLHHSPVSKQLGGALDPLHADGPTRTQLVLNLPIMHPNRFSLKGKLILNGVTARYGGLPFALENMKGHDRFDGKGPLSGRFTARLKGAPVVLDLGRSARRKAVLATLTGNLPAKTVASTMRVPPGKYLKGTLPMKLTLAIPLARKGPPISLDMNSSLRGLAIKLPAPLGKAATAAVPVAVHLAIHGPRLDVAARYGDVLSGCADIDLAAGTPAVRGLHLVLGKQGCTTAKPGLLVTGSWPELDLDPWSKIVSKQLFTTGSVAAGSPMKFDALGFNVHLGVLKFMHQHFSNEQVSGRLGRKQLQLALSGEGLEGKALIPRRPTNSEPIVANLTHATFAVPRKPVVPSEASAASPATVASAVSVTRLAQRAEKAQSQQATAQATRAKAASAKPLHPQDIPPFVFHAEHLDLGGAAFNDVRVEARRVAGGILLKPIKIGGGATDFNGTLVWIQPAGGHGHGQGAIQFLAHVHDLGKLLKGVGLGPVVTGHGAASASLAWSEQSSKGASFTDQLLGKISMDLRNGQISQVNPGAGRLLTLLNLANIPRYLTLNFHNLTGKGFPFSRIYGDYEIRRGIASTRGLVIDSSLAWIKLTGSMNLDKQTLDQRALIEPNYTGSLPIIGALVGGLGVGAAVFAITKIFGVAIAQASQLDYSITGPFSHPTVKPVGAKPAPSPGTRGKPAGTHGG